MSHKKKASSNSDFDPDLDEALFKRGEGILAKTRGMSLEKWERFIHLIEEYE